MNLNSVLEKNHTFYKLIRRCNMFSLEMIEKKKLEELGAGCVGIYYFAQLSWRVMFHTIEALHEKKKYLLLTH